MSGAGTTRMHPVVRRFVEEAGALTQSLGVGRVIGQIYAYLYLSRAPRSLADIQEALGISKGGASMGVRQLEQWGASRRVWVKGDRRDYYEADDWFGRILKNAVIDTVGKRMASCARMIEEAETMMGSGAYSEMDEAFLRERIRRLRKFQQKAEKLWNQPLIRKLLER